VAEGGAGSGAATPDAGPTTGGREAAAAAVPGLGRRAGLVLLVVVAVAASAVALDQGLGTAGSGAAPSEATSGAWFCPHGGGEGWSVWVIAANPGASPVTVRFTTLGPRGVTDTATVSLGASREISRKVPATDPASATQIEYFGGFAGAAAVVRPESGAPGLAALRCASTSRATWYLPDALTTPDRTATVVVMNPFAEVAEFDVAFQSEDRVVRPGDLTPMVLGPHRAVAVKVNAYVLQTPSEDTMTATVTSRIGRVVAGALDRSPGGIRAEVGVPGPERGWILPAVGYEGSAALTIVNPSEDRVDLSVVAQGPRRQKLVSSVEGVSVAPGSVATLQVEGMPNAGMLTTTTNDRPFVAALRLVGTNGDPAQQAGTADPSRRWLVLPAVPPDAGQGRLVVQNPGNAAANLTITLLGPDGLVPAPARLTSVTVPPGRTLSFAIPSTGGTAPAVAVVASAPVVAAMAGTVEVGYATTLGLPMSG
jgi:Family of unknown function (DUF5719)